jgi:putative transposase
MPRRPRLLVDGGYYHILTRGNDRRKLFRCKQDYNYFLKIIERYLVEFQVNILHYCLMPNHIHLLIHAQKAKDLPKFMQVTLQVYASYFRRRYRSVGFVFQNRYKSCFINKDSYLLECARYIERNPLRAKITDDFLSYPWSSFSFYSKGMGDSIIRVANPLYLGLAKTEQKRQLLYQNYVSEERPYEHIVDEVFRIR